MSEKNELFKKRWERYRKMGSLKYSLFLGSLYAFTIFIVSLLFDHNEGDLPFAEILTYVSVDLLVKTGTFFFFGILFGYYHFRKSERKYKEGI